MPRKPKPPPDNPEQFKRFIDMAREVEAEQPSPNFERVFRKVAEQPKGAPWASRSVGRLGLVLAKRADARNRLTPIDLRST
jgi:hypothetical protein